jgi:hypothetical protein
VPNCRIAAAGHTLRILSRIHFQSYTLTFVLGTYTPPPPPLPPNASLIFIFAHAWDTPHNLDNNLPENVRCTTMLGAEIILMPHVTGGTASSQPGRGVIDRALWDQRERDPVPLQVRCVLIHSLISHKQTTLFTSLSNFSSHHTNDMAQELFFFFFCFATLC